MADAGATSREIRTSVVPKPGGTATQGPDYNGCLGRFAASLWQITTASKRSKSLSRAVSRIRSFQPVWADET
ncbi:MAG TPA: hypothetical protein DEH78_12680 [Solibacterales bacterium]|nr:hypothetical protein [Bryobacterales bacterium]